MLILRMLSHPCCMIYIKITKKGIPIVVKLTNLNIKVRRNDQIPDELKGFDKYNSLSGDIDIELEEIISPSLPIK